jgi:predicted DNA-binding transcriptional regulator AlpA
MHPDDLAELARLVADDLAERIGDELDALRDAPAPAETRWLDATEVADMLGIGRDSVYRQKARLGAVKLGEGPKARLRFDAATVTAALGACSDSRDSLTPDLPPRQRSRQRRPAADRRAFPLLPVRGVE